MEFLLLILFLIYCSNYEKFTETRSEIGDFEGQSELYSEPRFRECILEVMDETADTPIRGYEKDICEKSIETGVDYHLVLRIGYLESRLCSNTNFQYNCWSVDVHNRQYSNYHDSIVDVFELLERYREVYGLETIEEIVPKYCPSCGNKYIQDFYSLDF